MLTTSRSMKSSWVQKTASTLCRTWRPSAGTDVNDDYSGCALIRPSFEDIIFEIRRCIARRHSLVARVQADSGAIRAASSCLRSFTRSLTRAMVMAPVYGTSSFFAVGSAPVNQRW